MRGSGYVNAYREQRKRRPRQDACGHALIARTVLPTGQTSVGAAEVSVPPGASLAEIVRCSVCGHTWLEVSP